LTNGDKEAVLVTLRNVQAYHHDGTLYWSYWTGNYDYILGSPTLIDLNNDGKLETIIGSDNGSPMCWTIKVSCCGQPVQSVK
jgi:hypothetical protein